MRCAVIVVLIIFACVQALPLYAAAMSNCAPLSVMAEELGIEFGEARHAAGLSTQGTLFQVFMSEAGTWTLVISAPDGHACALAAGTNWETYPIPKTGTEG